jgi:OmpA-OmpF porin, OOP family
MQKISLLSVLLIALFYSVSLAQPAMPPTQNNLRTTTQTANTPTPPDKIFLKDKRVLECYIVSVNATEVRYRLDAPAGSTVFKLSRAQVIRVERERPKTTTGTPVPKPVTTPTPDATTDQTALETSVQQSDNPLRQLLDSLRARPSLKGLRIKLKDINFETNSATMLPASQAYIDTIATALNKFPALMLEIGGHTDNVGKATENVTLSEQRANAVRSRLVGSGLVAAKRLTAKGYGQSRPVANNTTDIGKQKNRRVEMLFVGLDNTQSNRIYRANGEIINAPLVYVDDRNQSVFYKLSDSAPLEELSCAEVKKVVYADGREQTIVCRDRPPVAPSSGRQMFASRKDSKFNVKLLGGVGYMIAPELWTDKANGYAHVLGYGVAALATYQFSKRIGIAVEPGYWQFSTQVDYKTSNDGNIIKQYNSKATQLSLFLALPVYITDNVYIMPEGGINLLNIKAGFDGKDDSFSGIQPGAGASVGYTSDRSKRIQFDLGLFYRTGLKLDSWQQQYGVPMMHYAGLRAGLGFSL